MADGGAPRIMRKVSKLATKTKKAAQMRELGHRMVGRYQKHKFARLTPIGLAKCLIRMAMTIRERTAESNSESEEGRMNRKKRKARIHTREGWHCTACMAYGKRVVEIIVNGAYGAALCVPCIRLAARATELPSEEREP